MGLLIGGEGGEGTLWEDVVLEGTTIDDGGLGVIVVFWGADDDVLVLPIFWSPKIFTRNFSMVVDLPDLCLQMILDHLAKTEGVWFTQL